MSLSVTASPQVVTRTTPFYKFDVVAFDKDTFIRQDDPSQTDVHTGEDGNIAVSVSPNEFNAVDHSSDLQNGNRMFTFWKLGPFSQLADSGTPRLARYAFTAIDHVGGLAHDPPVTSSSSVILQYLPSTETPPPGVEE